MSEVATCWICWDKAGNGEHVARVNDITTNSLSGSVPRSWLYISIKLSVSIPSLIYLSYIWSMLGPMLQWMFRQWHYVYIVSLYMIGLEQSLKCWQQIIQTSTRFSFVFWLHWKYHFSLHPPLCYAVLSPHCCRFDQGCWSLELRVWQYQEWAIVFYHFLTLWFTVYC